MDSYDLGRGYRDYYLVVCENLRIESANQIRKKLKHFFQTYLRRVNWHMCLPSHYPCPCNPLINIVEKSKGVEASSVATETSEEEIGEKPTRVTWHEKLGLGMS